MIRGGIPRKEEYGWLVADIEPSVHPRYRVCRFQCEFECREYVQILYQCLLYTHTIPPQPSPSTPRSIILPTLIHPKHRARNARQKHQVPRRQPLGLKNPLQKWQVNHRHLAQQAAPNGEIKHLVADEVQLPAQHALALAAAGQRVEHVEEDEAGEGHGGVARVDGVVDGHFADVDDDGAEHDDGGGGEDALDEGAGEDAGGAGAGGAGHDGWVDGLDAEGLRGGAVHKDIWRRFSA